MKNFATLAAGICVLFLCGCSGSRQYVRLPNQARNVSDPAKGRIYLLRPAEATKGPAVEIIVDKNLIGETGPKGFLCWERSPGTTVVMSSSKGNSKVSFQVAAGGVYYLVQHVGSGLWYAENSLKLVDEAEGREILKGCKPPFVSDPPIGSSLSPIAGSMFAEGVRSPVAGGGMFGGGGGYSGASGGSVGWSNPFLYMYAPAPR